MRKIVSGMVVFAICFATSILSVSADNGVYHQLWLNTFDSNHVENVDDDAAVYTLQGVGSYDPTIRTFRFEKDVKLRNYSDIISGEMQASHLFDENGYYTTTIVLNGDNEIDKLNITDTYQFKATITGNGSLKIGTINSNMEGKVIDQAFFEEHFVTNLAVTYKDDCVIIGTPKATEDSEATITKDKFESNNIIFESSTPLDGSYHLMTTDIMSMLTEEQKNTITKKGQTLLGIYDISIMNQTNNVVPMANGNFTIRIPLNGEMKKYKSLAVGYVKDGQVAETFNTKIEGDYLVFVTSHLSEYAVFGLGDTVNPNTVDSIVFYVFITIIGLFGMGSVCSILRKRTQN